MYKQIRRGGFIVENYTLKENYILRGWRKLPFVAVNTTNGEPIFFQREDFETLSLCNGEFDFGLPAIKAILSTNLDNLLKKGIIESGKRKLSPFQEYKNYDCKYLKDVQWSITSRCNYKCRHCFESAPSKTKAKDLSTDECIKIIDDMASCGVSGVSITGGEPLVRKDFLELVDALVERHILLNNIFTNGSLLTPK